MNIKLPSDAFILFVLGVIVYQLVTFIQFSLVSPLLS